MQPVQTAYTDTYTVPCPHNCGQLAVVQITRQRGQAITDLSVTHITQTEQVVSKPDGKPKK